MPLVLWSGGCDSTLVLFDLLRKRQAQGILGLPDDPVRAVSFTHPQVMAQEENRKARLALIPILENRFGKFARSEFAITLDGFGCSTNGGCIQPMMWMLQAALCLEKSEDLYIGYVRTDCALVYRPQLYAGFSAIQEMNYRTGKLFFPLEWTQKPEIITRLKTERLYRHTWYCESPENGKKCGKCSPCTTHRTALWKISQGLAS